MMAAETPLKMRVRCPCSRWEWRSVAAMAGLGPCAVPQACPRCRREYLIVYRVGVTAGVRAKLLGVVELAADGETALRSALEQVDGLQRDELEMLVTVARLLAGPQRVGGAA